MSKSKVLLVVRKINLDLASRVLLELRSRGLELSDCSLVLNEAEAPAGSRRTIRIETEAGGKYLDHNCRSATELFALQASLTPVSHPGIEEMLESHADDCGHGRADRGGHYAKLPSTLAEGGAFQPLLRMAFDIGPKGSSKDQRLRFWYEQMLPVVSAYFTYHREGAQVDYDRFMRDLADVGKAVGLSRTCLFKKSTLIATLRGYLAMIEAILDKRGTADKAAQVRRVLGEWQPLFAAAQTLEAEYDAEAERIVSALVLGTDQTHFVSQNLQGFRVATIVTDSDAVVARLWKHERLPKLIYAIQARRTTGHAAILFRAQAQVEAGDLHEELARMEPGLWVEFKGFILNGSGTEHGVTATGITPFRLAQMILERSRPTRLPTPQSAADLRTRPLREVRRLS